MEKIERYLAGELSGEELISFEEQLKTDADLAEDVRLSKLADETIRENLLLIRFREKLEEEYVNYIGSNLDNNKHLSQNETGESFTDNGNSAKQSPQKKKLKVFWFAAAALILLVTLSLWYIMCPKEQLSDKQIALNHFEVYQGDFFIREINSSEGSDLEKALQTYDLGNYQEALNLFESVQLTDENMLVVSFFAGVSNMAAEHYDKATDLFKDVIDDGDNQLIHDAKWYLALCYLQTDERQNAIVIFEELEKDSRYYGERAKEIVRELGENVK